MSRLRSFAEQRLSIRISSTPSHITTGPDEPWTEVGSGRDHLARELEHLYWQGVEDELENIVQALQEWQDVDPSANMGGAAGTDGHDGDSLPEGFDTFVDQVSDEARFLAQRHGPIRKMDYRIMNDSRDSERYLESSHAFEDNIRDRRAEYVSSKIKSELRSSLQSPNQLSGIHRLAWMLLQASGFLDIDKLIEHRQPLGAKQSQHRPGIPQVVLRGLDKRGRAKFEPLSCMGTGCGKLITSSMYVLNQTFICEDCYRAHHYGDEAFRKKCKYCILPEVITPEVSGKMCHCENPPRYGSKGQSSSLFPVGPDAPHIPRERGSEGCNLVNVGESVAQAQHEALIESRGEVQSKKKREKPDEKRQGKNKSGYGQGDQSRARGLSLATNQPPPPPPPVLDVEDDENIPQFLRECVDDNVWGNIHMALRVGPLVIENGVSNTNGGALVRLRDMPVFHERGNSRSMHRNDMAVGADKDRLVWKRPAQFTGPKKYKAILKQVVGAPFMGVLPPGHELEIVDVVVSLADGIHRNSGDARPNYAPALEKLKYHLQSRVRIYLDTITRKILDPTIVLGWHYRHNPCQTFVNAVLDQTIFSPLFIGPRFVSGDNDRDASANPLYAMSFVAQSEADPGLGLKPKPPTKFDVPMGLAEEYLLNMQLGLLDDSDLIDKQLEYWYSWGALEGPLNCRRQHLFPWDCTEAYGRNPVECGDCSMMKHLWAFPFDSWCVTEMHLARDKYLYVDDGLVPPYQESEKSEYVFKSEAEQKRQQQRVTWLNNRLQVLQASEVLGRVAAAMATNTRLRKATSWMHEVALLPTSPGNKSPRNPSPRREASEESQVRNRALSNPALATRAKLGGIHRAQPFSHAFELGTGSAYFIAPWAIFPLSDRIAEYERLRDIRANKLTDVHPDTWAPRFKNAKSSANKSFRPASTPRDMAGIGLPGFGNNIAANSYPDMDPPWFDPMHQTRDAHQRGMGMLTGAHFMLGDNIGANEPIVGGSEGFGGGDGGGGGGDAACASRAGNCAGNSGDGLADVVGVAASMGGDGGFGGFGGDGGLGGGGGCGGIGGGGGGGCAGGAGGAAGGGGGF